MISFQSLRQQLGILPKLPTILGIFCKVAEVFHFSCRNHFWATFIDIWRLFSGHTGAYSAKKFYIIGPRRLIWFPNRASNRQRLVVQAPDSSE